MTTAPRVDIADTRGQTTALTVTGDLDLQAVAVFHHTVADVLSEHPTVILDLTGVTFCDSSGLNTLLRLRRRAQEVGGRLVLVAPPRQMLRLLSVTGAVSVFTIHGSLAEAWEAIPASDPPPTA